MSINLLPWRDMQKRDRKRYITVRLIITSLTSLLCCILSNTALIYYLKKQAQVMPSASQFAQLNMQLTHYQNEKSFLHLASKIKRYEIRTYNQLKLFRVSLIKIANLLPRQMLIKTIDFLPRKIVLSGKANNTVVIYHYFQLLSDNQLGKSFRLLSLDKDKNSTLKLMNFRMQIIL